MTSQSDRPAPVTNTPDRGSESGPAWSSRCPTPGYTEPAGPINPARNGAGPGWPIPAQRNGQWPGGAAQPPATSNRHRPAIHIAGIAIICCLVATIAITVLNHCPTAPPSPPPRTTPTAPQAPLPVVSADGLVQLGSAAANDSGGRAVLSLLDHYFTAINNHDFADWRTTVTERRGNQQGADNWYQGYRSTRDSDVVVTSITDAGGDQLTVGLTFVSHQNPGDAPSDLPVQEICWNSAYPVIGISSGGLIDTPPNGTTEKSGC